MGKVSGVETEDLGCGPNRTKMPDDDRTHITQIASHQYSHDESAG
jgi:hypothetical protein